MILNTILSAYNLDLYHLIWTNVPSDMKQCLHGEHKSYDVVPPVINHNNYFAIIFVLFYTYCLCINIHHDLIKHILLCSMFYSKDYLFKLV